ncbi:MAG: chemotaxis response regulator protein-glutamate methylesterase [Ignavibacteriales bacterium]
MLPQKIRVVIVDDSAFMRKSLSMMLEGDDSITVIGTARDGIEGYELVKKEKPDLVTLDIEMPRMDGLTALKKIMKDCPTSVLMVSSLTTEGAEATLKAMEYGAVDFISKEMSFVSINIAKIKDDLIRKVKSIVLHKRSVERIRRIQSNFERKTTVPDSSNFNKNIPSLDYKAIALGISTGGPLSLQKVIPKLSSKIKVPIFIVQHMPPHFTKSLAERLNSMSELEVKEAANGDIIQDGHVYIAPGGFHMFVKNGNGHLPVIKLSDTPSDTLHRPSVDVMVESVVDYYGKRTLGIIMTGMGKDGLNGIAKLKGLGGTCIAQNEESCVVYGMPKAVVDAGFADAVLSLDEIPNTLNKVFAK